LSLACDLIKINKIGVSSIWKRNSTNNLGLNPTTANRKRALELHLAAAKSAQIKWSGRRACRSGRMSWLKLNSSKKESSLKHLLPERCTSNTSQLQRKERKRKRN
jgi:hypothetical protein